MCGFEPVSESLHSSYGGWDFSPNSGGTVKGKKVKAFIQRLYCSTSHSRRSGVDHTVLPAITPMPAFTS